MVEERPQVREEGDTLIIPVVKKEIVIEKKLLLVEELRVRKEKIETHRPQTFKVMKEEVDIKRIAKNDDIQTPDETG
jgi:stress response protein YsnF